MTDPAVEIEIGFERLDVEFIYELLGQTHWARNRPRDVFERALKHSLCFGAYEGKRQVGFARVVTDHATFGYVQDFIVDPARRGRGIGRSLLQRVMEDPIVSSLVHSCFERRRHTVCIKRPALRWRRIRRILWLGIGV